MCISFHMLSSTAGDYLAPAVTKISETLGLSETLAGVTLLALGFFIYQIIIRNGAPDVLVSVAATLKGGDEEGGINFAIGAIFGAALFGTTLTISMVLELSGGNLKLNSQNFLRDAGFYLFANGLLIVYGIIGYANLYMCIIFVAIYIIFIIIVLIMEKKQSTTEKDNIMQSDNN